MEKENVKTINPVVVRSLVDAEYYVIVAASVFNAKRDEFKKILDLIRGVYDSYISQK